MVCPGLEGSVRDSLRQSEEESAIVSRSFQTSGEAQHNPSQNDTNEQLSRGEVSDTEFASADDLDTSQGPETSHHRDRASE